MGMSKERWMANFKLPVMHQYIVDKSGEHPGAVHGPKIKVNGSRIARGKRVGTQYFTPMTQHERVTWGRLERQKLREQGFKKTKK